MIKMHLARAHDNTTPGEIHDTQHTIHGGATQRPGALLIVPKGPNGEPRPAVAVGCVMHVARTATIEVQDIGYKHPVKRNSCLADSFARKNATAPDDQRETARHAAKLQWGG